VSDLCGFSGSSALVSVGKPSFKSWDTPSPWPSSKLSDTNTDQNNIKDKATKDLATVRPIDPQRAKIRKLERK
jgi:hypothetical protein